MSESEVQRATTEIVMDRMPLKPRPCPIAATMELVGDRWSMLVVRELSYGVHRFGRIAGYLGVLYSLFEWGDGWAVDRPPAELVHNCGHPVHIAYRCRYCDEEVDSTSVAMHAHVPRE